MNDIGISCELGGNSKRRRVEEDATDRLSHLPVFVIRHILSFLDTKSAVQTSVLSRVWRCAWKHVPVLSFRSGSFDRYSSFQSFVGNVVSLRDPVGDVVGKISYIDNEGSDELDCELFGKVIKYALSHDTHHLVVDTNSTSCSCDYSFSDLFGTISSCNLTTLELQSVLIDEAFAHSGFRMLTTLNLELCELEYDLDEYLDPLSGCPCLQNLVLNHCSHFVKISGPQLLRLTLDCVYCDPWEQIEIFAPRLKFLSLLPELEDMKFSKLSIPCLDHVDIRVTDMNDFLEGNEECVAQRFISLFEYLNNAISLTLGPHTIRVLSGMTEFLEQQPSSPFRRLKTLIMEADSVPYALINYFLKGSSMKPNLEFV